jgi:hypothetical protein
MAPWEVLEAPFFYLVFSYSSSIWRKMIQYHDVIGSSVVDLFVKEFFGVISSDRCHDARLSQFGICFADFVDFCVFDGKREELVWTQLSM